MKRLLVLMVIFSVGCGFPPLAETPVKVPPKRYVVVSVFGEVMLTTEDEEEAYKTAHNLTLMGRVFVSKPDYFVKELE